jgi:phosphonopyruvate decarboxylase
MIEAEHFIRSARQYGFSIYTGVPCSYLKPFINYVIDADDLRYIGAANEGDAVAIAAGAELAGQHAVAMFQNSGLGNAVNPLTSLTHTFEIPILVITTLRGEPGGSADEPQHDLMGAITIDLLELMGLAWSYFPVAGADIDPVLQEATGHMERTHRPYALVMRKGSVAKRQLETAPAVRDGGQAPTAGRPLQAQHSRREMLKAVQAAVTDKDVIVATTGYTGRELYACGDRANQFYMVGSMGCAVSVGLGLAVAQPDRRVLVLDGDGAALMRLGALTTVGYEQPANLLHVLLDNGMHESTGGQATVSRSIDFCAIAAASGYPSVTAAADPQALTDAMRRAAGSLGFIHAPTLPGVADDLPRPSMTPSDVAVRFRRQLTA